MLGSKVTSAWISWSNNSHTSSAFLFFMMPSLVVLYFRNSKPNLFNIPLYPCRALFGWQNTVLHDTTWHKKSFAAKTRYNEKKMTITNAIVCFVFANVSHKIGLSTQYR